MHIYFGKTFAICLRILVNKQKFKKFTGKQTNIITELAKTIYPLYTSYQGGGGINIFESDITYILRFLARKLSYKFSKSNWKDILYLEVILQLKSQCYKLQKILILSNLLNPLSNQQFIY